ncbi:hypothetical protein GCM10020367_13370 [Streptomyces sannanensis]|uniref:Secreted protein n=1 Tax=Streptomyces sannanensis TaxID=285536 RepID=A0ABP6S827_9ACTN
MTARTHTRSHASASGGVEIRLPWWAIALPVMAFAVLLLLMTGSGSAYAADGGPAITQLLERVQQTLSH